MHIDPVEWTSLIEDAFCARLADEHGSDPNAVHERLGALLADLDHLVRNATDRANVRFTALAVAAFEVLAPAHGRDAAVAIVDDCLNTPLSESLLISTAAALDEATDPFDVIVTAAKDREETYFGPSFTFERPVDDHDTYVLDVRRCLFHETLVAAGHAELQPILCSFDLNWADAIDPDRHHLRFERPVTFASGSVCRMLFTRREHLR